MIDKLKRDTDINWAKAKNFTPKKDEIIIYDFLDGPKIKIGDGITKVNDLPFASDTLQINNIHSVRDDTLIINN